MRKLISRSLLAAALFLTVCYFGCEKYLSEPSETAKAKIKSLVTDGYCDIVFLSAKQKGNYTTAEFNRDADSATAAIKRWEPFASATNLRFYRKKLNGTLGCDDNVTGSNNVETIQCDQTKVINACEGITSNRIDVIVILASGFGHASFDGTIICAIGLGNHAPALSCTFWDAAYDGKLMKELGRRFGCAQQDTVGSKMNSGTSGGCDIADFPYTLPEQEIILMELNSL